MTRKTNKIPTQPGILDIAPYVGGKSKLAGRDHVIKLSSNENPFGPSPRAQAAYSALAMELHRYPSADHTDLREVLGTHYGLAADQIICGAGSDEIFTFLCQAYTGVGDEVIVTEHGFSMHKICALAAGATPITVAEDNRTVSIDNILGGVSDKTKLVFLANPGNPTGTFVERDALERLATSLPAHVLLVIDGAYAEFADYLLHDGYDGGAGLVELYPNVVMTRTFSKVYALGAARVGWGYADPQVIDVLNRVRGPFNVNAGALAAAHAAVLDQAFTSDCLRENLQLGQVMTQRLRGIGLAVDQSYANFLLVRFDSASRADAAYAALLDAGIITRQVKGYGFPEALRITIGTQTECEAVLSALEHFAAGAL
ncbi:MAG: histidinol-phosphate transaminase [Pseudomonadota bacterium]